MTTPRDRVLDAFEEAVVLHGVQGASFARIAEVGGFHRSLVQHHFGTRSALLEAALERVTGHYARRTAELIEGLPPAERLEALLDWLLSPFPPEGPPRIAKVVDALLALANVHPGVRRRIRGLYEGFVDALVQALVARHPSAEAARLRSVAVTLVGLSFGRAGLDALGLPEAASPSAREACDRLLSDLG